jgi:hypothetical protein
VTDLIPFEDEKEMRMIRRVLVEVLGWHFLPHITGFVLTKYSKMHIRTYLYIFAKNFFDSMRTTLYYLKNKEIYWKDVPDNLYHGTTTTFLPDIMKEGLLPSKVGLNWNEDKEKRVYLTDSLYAAEFFALHAQHNHGGATVIFRVCAKDLKSKLMPKYEKILTESIRIYEAYKQFLIEEPIPPRYIRNFYLLPEDVSLFHTLNNIKEYYSRQMLIDAKTK